MIAPKSFNFSGTGAAVTLSTICGGVTKAKFVQFQVPTGNSGTVRIGGSEVTSAVGFPLVGSSGQMFPPVAEFEKYYPLDKVFVYVANGDALNGLYGG